MKIEVTEIAIPDCQRGDILTASDRRLRAGHHPIVFFDHAGSWDFIGCMLTHEEIDENAPMLESHFLHTSDEFTYENTQIVKGKFIKFGNWGPFYKVGKLSESGIAFVESLIDSLPPETFANYFRRQMEK
jgi:hypothetical protein